MTDAGTIGKKKRNSRIRIQRDQQSDTYMLTWTESNLIHGPIKPHTQRD